MQISVGVRCNAKTNATIKELDPGRVGYRSGGHRRWEFFTKLVFYLLLW